jgi:metal-responsive CopG/Arc/MetJ family transcriptional regulator
MASAKIAISLPEELLRLIDLDRGSGMTRSEYFRRAIEDSIRRRAAAEASARYQAAYLAQPEDDDELAWSRASIAALAAEPWEG